MSRQNSIPTKCLTQVHDHTLISYDDPESIWWCDGGAGGTPSPLCEVGGNKEMSGRYHCSEGCNYDLCPPCVTHNRIGSSCNSRRSSNGKISLETDALLGPKNYKSYQASLVSFGDCCTLFNITLRWILILLLLFIGILCVAVWLKNKFLNTEPAAFVFPISYRISSNFTLMLAKFHVQATGSFLYSWENERLAIDFDQSASLLNATGTDLNYYDYTKEPPHWSSRTMYDPLTSSKINGLAFLHDGTGTSTTGDYYYYSVINGTYSCSKFKYQVPPRDLFVLDGKYIGTRSINGEPCHVWRAPYNNGIIEQWVSVETQRPKRQLASLHYPVGGGVEAQALLITDFLAFEQMKIPDYVFPPPFTCLS